jgi:alkylhydroperoxidase family enzyme
MGLIAAGPPRTGEEPTEEERAAADFAESMTRANADVDEESFARLKARFGDDQIVELAAWVALQSFYSTFNRALRIT